MFLPFLSLSLSLPATCNLQPFTKSTERKRTKWINLWCDFQSKFDRWANLENLICLHVSRRNTWTRLCYTCSFKTCQADQIEYVSCVLFYCEWNFIDHGPVSEKFSIFIKKRDYNRSNRMSLIRPLLFLLRWELLHFANSLSANNPQSQ